MTTCAYINIICVHVNFDIFKLDKSYTTIILNINYTLYIEFRYDDVNFGISIFINKKYTTIIPNIDISSLDMTNIENHESLPSVKCFHLFVRFLYY